MMLRSLPLFALLVACMPDSGPPIERTDGAAPDAGVAPPGDAGPPARDADAPSDALPPPPPPDSGPPAAECYEEPIDSAADLSDVVAGYGGPDWKDDLIEAVRRRYPAGAWLLDRQRDDPYFDEFSDPSSWPRMVDSLATLVHEETHLFDAYEAIERGEHLVLYFREDRIFVLPAWMEGFPRSEILPSVDVHPESYASTYLTGEQGSRGFIALLDETTCYVNEMAALALLGDQYEGLGFSSRDGAVAFLYYTALYLRRARESHPDFYARLRESELARDIVRTQWLRAHFFLDSSDRFPSLGIHDRAFREGMYRPENLDEMAAFLGVRVGDSPCVLP